MTDVARGTKTFPRDSERKFQFRDQILRRDIRPAKRFRDLSRNGRTAEKPFRTGAGGHSLLASALKALDRARELVEE